MNPAYDLDNIYTYHAPLEEQQRIYVQLRAAARQLAEQILAEVPASRERSLALTNLEQSVFWANAAVARSPQTLTGGRDND
jgi:hypothetical protein